jgi:hypothetical protein
MRIMVGLTVVLATIATGCASGREVAVSPNSPGDADVTTEPTVADPTPLPTAPSTPVETHERPADDATLTESDASPTVPTDVAVALARMRYPGIDGMCDAVHGDRALRT